LLNLLKTKKKISIKIQSRKPLNISESAVPILSARIPKGTALKGMIPNVIMAMLTMRPLISGDEYDCIKVMLSDINIALRNPMSRRMGRAVA
jgi:hypothetical protein